MTRALLSGNEAIARGAWEAGARIGVGYPGTPSTETLETFAKMSDAYAEWAANEKVALEVAAGASMGGKRALVTMKHVGLNVASDPLFTLAYTGVGAGLVILVADDPGMHSSRNEQDSRNYAAFAGVPMLEPSDSAEAREMTMLAFELSERFDVPVLIRSSTRVSHAKSTVDLREGIEAPEREPYATNAAKWVMMPAMARQRRIVWDERVLALAEYAETSEVNRIEMRSKQIGVVASGVSYVHVREALPDASILKLGMSFPLPARVIREFADQVEALYVVEEAGDYLARSIRSLGIDVAETQVPKTGELTPGAIRRAFGFEEPPTRQPEKGLPPRPPLMCAGCPHRPAFNALRKLRAVVTGDIGCYTLGALPPLGAMDSCVCMGASIGMAHGMELAGGVERRPVVAVIGDSTFAHSGITALVNTAYNAGTGTILILDNRITAMTGHQGNPVNGITLGGDPGAELDLAKLAEAIGIRRVREIDPHDLSAVESALKEETAAEELSVIVLRAPCALLVRDHKTPYAVDEDACTACGVCIRLGCPAIATSEGGEASIDVTVCVGCGQCLQVCRYEAIVSSGPACDLGDGR